MDRNHVCMNLLCITPAFILTPLLLMIVPITAMAQPSSGDDTALQKKAIEAQAHIKTNKDDHDQLMIAVKTNEVPLAKQVFSETDLPPKTWKTRRLLCGLAAEREVKTK